MTDYLLFAVFPYICIVMAIVGSIWRYTSDRFSYSSLSSQFLETRQLFWGSVAWHYGILLALTAHFVAFLIPDTILWWNGVPARLYAMEVTGFVFGLLALAGVIFLLIRRITTPRIRVVSSKMDYVLLIALLLQVATGIWTALFYRWGSSWYSAFGVPYLWSVLELRPDIQLVNNLPVMTKIHIVNAYFIVLLIPFTRLVHFLSIPVEYIWRPHQIVRWYQREDVTAPNASSLVKN